MVFSGRQANARPHCLRYRKSLPKQPAKVALLGLLFAPYEKRPTICLGVSISLPIRWFAATQPSLKPPQWPKGYPTLDTRVRDVKMGSQVRLERFQAQPKWEIPVCPVYPVIPFESCPPTLPERLPW